jgi:2-polyprenyl-3-methyl-5-hydroxy-6-metoxy-1,4-benzoquinol methylase
LEIGCAKGFVVEDLRGFGVDAYGLDISEYAISQASESIKPFLTVGDARSDLSQYTNKQFDIVFSLRFMECIPDSDISWLVAQMNRISQFQFHVIDEVIKPNFYTNMPLEEWIKFDWQKGTKLQSNEKSKKILTK